MDLDLVKENIECDEDKLKIAEVAIVSIDKCSETEIKTPEVIQIDEAKKAECDIFKLDNKVEPEENIPAEDDDAVNEGKEKLLQKVISKSEEVEIDLHKSIESILSESEEEGEDAAHPIEDDDEEEVSIGIKKLSKK